MGEGNNNMFTGKKVCFFSTVPREKLQFENYSIQDLRILDELGFEVVIANTFTSIPWNCDLYFSWWASGSVLPLVKAKLSRKPIVTIAGGNEAMLYRDSVTGQAAGYLNNPLWKKWATRITMMFSDRLLVVSQFMVNDAVKLGAKNPLVVHNCVDTALFCPQPQERKYITSIFKVDQNTVLLKRGEIFIRAIAEVVKTFPEQTFVIIGKKGDDFERIQSLINTLGISQNILFIDEIANSDVIDWINKSALYVQISDTETFGLAIAEAMSCEVPVMVSRCGAIPEVVGEHGIYVDHNSVDSVAGGIKEFLSLEQSKVDKIGRHFRSRIKSEFSYEKRKQQLTNIIQNVL
jgi:glycosyltransferase involved in cell wall biosynthesis